MLLRLRLMNQNAATVAKAKPATAPITGPAIQAFEDEGCSEAIAAVVVGLDVDVPVWPGDAFVAAVSTGRFSKPDGTARVLYFKLAEDMEALVVNTEEAFVVPLEIHVLVEK